MFGSKALRPIAGVVLVTFTSLTLQPLTAAAQLPAAPQRMQAQGKTAESADEHFSRTLNEVHELLKELVPAAAMPQAMKPAPAKPGEKELRAIGPGLRIEAERAAQRTAWQVDVPAKTRELRARIAALLRMEGEVKKSFAETERHIRDKHLPAEILARHEAAVAEYERRATEFKRLAAAVESAADGQGDLESALGGLGAFMAKYPNAKTHTPTDPNNLPWGSPKPVTRKPYTTPAQFKTSRLFGEPIKVAQAGSLSGIGLPSTTLPATPTPADLAPTEDVQITQAITALAASLNNQPVAIYNWVRNNIQFVPSYGSIQGSDMTLQTKRGNAFDTASLLIALMRAANVPARYVYGTIEVPVDKAMNWVGGVTVPEAALNLMGQGGIPNAGVAQGGKVKWIDLEHVWVEAYVDYVPSRGAVNRTPNTWVPLDASFKQYAYSQGMDVKANVPFDAQGFVNQAQVGATVNQTEGWMQNLNQANIQTALTTYQTQVQNYINTTNPNATGGDVLGNKNIISENYSILLGTLPYKTLVTGSRFDAVPDNFKWKYRTTLYPDATSYAQEYSDMANLSQNTVSLTGKKVTISFIPATQADVDLINSYLPNPHVDGTPIQPFELPTSLPGYLLQLKAEFRVDGQLVAQSTTGVTMGSELFQATAMYNPGTGHWEEGEANKPIAGEYHAITLDLQGAEASQIATLKTKLEQTKAKLAQFQADPSNTTPVAELTKEDLAGDLLYAGILGYFASVDGSDAVTAKTSNQVVSYRAPSYGAFIVKASPRYWFGIVRSVTYPGVVMDVDRVSYQTAANNDDNAMRVAYLRQAGAAGSAFEHVVPERLFADLSKPLTDPNQPQGVSAVKALAIAASIGQKIYTLNAKNQAYHAQIVAQLQVDADAKQEIANALNVGKEVTVHQADVLVNGWTGSGYIILDPVTGAGAYKISGGANGSYLDTWNNGLGTYVGLALALTSLVAVAFGVSAILTVILALLSIFVALMNFLVIDLQTSGCSGIGVMGKALEAVSVILSFFGGAGVALGAWISFLSGGAISGVSSLSQCKGY